MMGDRDRGLIILCVLSIDVKTARDKGREA
jgi:hypothetical protein